MKLSKTLAAVNRSIAGIWDVGLDVTLLGLMTVWSGRGSCVAQLPQSMRIALLLSGSRSRFRLMASDSWQAGDHIAALIMLAFNSNIAATEAKMIRAKSKSLLYRCRGQWGCNLSNQVGVCRY